MIKYVCGFLFDSPVANVALSRKGQGPKDMAGNLSGIGGKIEGFETPRAAQARGFKEETGVWVPPEAWTCFHVERYLETGHKVYFMAATSMLFHTCRTCGDEEVILLPADVPVIVERLMYPVVYNLCYMIPMAQMWLTRPGDRYFED